MKLETNFESYDEPLCVELSLSNFNLDWDFYYPIDSILDRIFDIKWKKKARKIFNEEFNNIKSSDCIYLTELTQHNLGNESSNEQ